MATSTGFPYNIVKHDEYEFSIEMALAGFSKEDIEVVVEDARLQLNQYSMIK